MWWIVLVAGALSVGIGVVQLTRYFSGGLGDRALRQSGPAETLVRAAMLVTGGLFFGFIGMANLIAQRMGGS